MTKQQESAEHAHFDGREAIQHVVEAQAQGVVDASEIHGSELPDHMSAGATAATEIAIASILLMVLLEHLGIQSNAIVNYVLLFGAGWIAWRAGRAAWLGWYRLERLHRLVEQEQWEIEHHRSQEREELKALYNAKGFEGELLDEVVDVLMADGDRLLRVMLEEEMGLRLEVYEHPLKLGLGALLGGSLALTIIVLTELLCPSCGYELGGFLAIALSAGVSSHFIGNRVIPAVVWNLGVTAVGYGATYFLLQLFMPGGN